MPSICSKITWRLWTKSGKNSWFQQFLHWGWNWRWYRRMAWFAVSALQYRQFQSFRDDCVIIWQNGCDSICPFSYEGIDIFGPLMVKHRQNIEKQCGVIFMCITIRALHIELVSVFEIYWSTRSAYRVLQEMYLVEQYSQASWKFGLKETGGSRTRTSK